jgi:hypothetical protein
MSTLKFVSLLTLICFSATLLPGCTTRKPMEQGMMPREELLAHIHPGDKIIIRLKNQDEYRITVESVEMDAIHAYDDPYLFSDDTEFLFSDIDEIYTEELSLGKTVLMVPAGVGAVGLYILVIGGAGFIFYLALYGVL